MEPAQISFGDITVSVWPQKIGRLKKRLPAVLEAIGADTTTASIDDVSGLVFGNAYAILCLLVPALEQRMTREEFDTSEDTSATFPEIRAAFRTVCQVNEVTDIPGLVGKLFGPGMVDFLRAKLLETILEFGASSTLPSETGESVSTSSGTTVPISTESTDSPSHGFVS